MAHIFVRQPAYDNYHMKRKANYQKTRKTTKKAKTQADEIVILKRNVRALKQANETHVKDTTIFGAFSSAVISGTWPSVAMTLNAPIQGDTVFDRQGSEVKGVGFKIKGNMKFNGAEIFPTTSTVRILVFCDKQNNGIANPSMLMTASANGVLQNDNVADVMVAPKSWQNKKRYQILKDFQIQNSPGFTTDYDPVTGNTSLVPVIDYPFEFYIPWTKITNYNNGNGGNAGDIVTNAVRFVAIQTTPGAANFDSISVMSRFFFKET